MSNDVQERLTAALKQDDACQRFEALGQLREDAPGEARDALMSFLDSPDQTTRRRAGGALSFFKLGRVTMEPQAAALAEHLQRHTDERVRLSCAILLMSVPGTAADRAFLCALADPFDKVAQIACVELESRCGAEGTTALFGMLSHPSWRVRLEACKALITQKSADRRVVTTLESMSREPEAAVYDAEVDESNEFVKAFSKAFSPDRTPVEGWGKVQAILAKAAAIASRERAGASGS
jgi:HEAT repeat protein